MAGLRTIREAKVGKLVLRLVRKDDAFIGLILDAEGERKLQIEGAIADNVWCRLHDEAGKANPKYFGFDGARARFLRFFPDGFRSSDYAKWERTYKLDAKLKLDCAAPLNAVAAGSGFGEAVLSAFQATNLLSPFELIRLRDMLREPAADAFIRAAARFAVGDMEPALLEMGRALKPYDCAKWTIVTYLPFLWRPDRHMFLKPEVTKDFAARVGHRFATDYQSHLHIEVYQSLLDLIEKTADELADLAPRDRIDVQSFVWIVSAYEEESEAAEV